MNEYYLFEMKYSFVLVGFFKIEFLALQRKF